MDALEFMGTSVGRILSEMSEQIHLEPGGFFVVGCSTSEVAGKRIGTSGALEIGETLYGPLKNFADKHDLHLAFQGCEHINRALTIEREAAKNIQSRTCIRHSSHNMREVRCPHMPMSR